MKCPDCNTEYLDVNQVICEFCGSELSKNNPVQIKRPLTKLEQFAEDIGLKSLYQKIKKSLKE